MTIDEAIEKFKFIANSDTSCTRYCMLPCDKCVDESKQLAEWLEELKSYRENYNGYNKEDIELNRNAMYNKAIDDFVKAVDKQCGYYAGECNNLTRDDLLKIAKELKDNG